MHTTLFSILFASLLFLAACENQPSQKSNASASSKPNIVLIMADDLGYGGISCYGNEEINTPHLDALAKQGIKFTDFHSNAPVCTPTRAALLTGKYQQKVGLEGVIYVRGETREVGLDTTALTIAELMNDNGYATGIMGKWHLGYKKEFNPVHHGFDEFYGYVSGNVDFHSHYDNAGIYDWWHNLDSIQEEGYVTDLITEHSVDFIKQHKEEPFFLYVPHEAPHVPFQGRNDPAYRFPDKEFTYYGPVEDQDRAYKEMVEVMDEGIGRIMEALRENGLEENTLVFFLSDNGAEEFGHNGILNGHKGGLLEGGHRVPAIAYWNGRIKAGQSSEQLMSMDLLPTILSVSGTETSEGRDFDGKDFSPVLFGEGEMPERTLFWRYRGQKAARENEWKLLITKSDTALYNLEADLRETTDLSEQHPDILKNLLNQLEDWEKEAGQLDEMKTI
ncbi:arylsulfatase A [Catalinimonas alkaloidigena]|uniref:sulfatase-like hydrolase/transferase n=1 Tax=Catalinimonas alkaloidigena TaxID=1075417 RepID=UPI00240758C2|nr:sulfatase-like hydrolase/transferase [Catalinimonas alkaloidigena]MDF9799618.1 arylsulfatase A [Catalinimonas alkaloidigena]